MNDSVQSSIKYLGKAHSPAGRLPLPPGPNGRKLRNLRERIYNFREFMGQLHREYGDIVFYQIPGQDCCAVFDADLISEFMTDRHDQFPSFNDESSYGIMKAPGVFRVRGETHRVQYAAIEEAFGAHMPFYIGAMLQHVHALPGRWPGARN